MEQNNKIVLFEAQQIRRTWHNETWYYSVIDVIEALTDTNRSRNYWSDLKKKLNTEGFKQKPKIWTFLNKSEDLKILSV